MAVRFAGASGGCGTVLRKTIGIRSAIGLRHPASASCLGRHLRLAGRCPNNSSLFPPLAAVVVVVLCAYSAEKLLIIEQCRAVCADRPALRFHGWGRGGKRHLPRWFPAETAARREEPSQAHCVRQLPRRGSFICANRKMTKSSPFGGAGCDHREQTERVSPLTSPLIYTIMLQK